MTFKPVLVLFILEILPIAVIYTLLSVSRRKKKSKRSPLTRDLLRSPGQSLRDKLNAIIDDINSYIGALFIGPIAIFAFYSAQPSLYQRSLFWLFFSISILYGYIFYKLWPLLKERNNHKLGLECEMAVGQELNNLMLDGYRVYHDFPAEKFNIDHIIVGPKGVFAVETKGRAKKAEKGGEAAVTVRYDGTALNFPGWSERQPADQAKSQAAWLSKWLSSAVGEYVPVRPVLAVPGWYLKKESPDNLLLFNGKNPGPLLNAIDGSLSPQLITRIAHQLEQRCRDIEPTAYSK